MFNDILLKIKPLIEERLGKNGFVLVDMRFMKNQLHQSVLEVLADRQEGGITLDECTRLNRELGDFLDQTGLIPTAYTLDVSSPGLDRPLVTPADFCRAKGRQVRMFLKEAVEGKIEYQGIIESVNADSVVIKTTTQTIEIPCGMVNKAKWVIL